jgi:uncharacterized membrane protein YeaQ/YmgE (transglycosylase-associated protein family)
MDWFEIVSFVVTGLLIGAFAKWVMPGRDPGGLLVTLLVGVAGAFVAGWIGRAIGWYHGERGPGIIASILGAVLLLAAWRLVKRLRPSK